MSGFFDWKSISEESILELEMTLEEDKVKWLLFKIFKVDKMEEKKQKIAVDFHFYNYAFCKEKAFDAKRTSTFMSIMHEALSRDSCSNSLTNDVGESFKYFQQLILKHSIERPPKSIQIFLPADVEPILDYALESYFRNFKLYSYIFGIQTKLVLQQVNTGYIEYPKCAMPLELGTEVQKNEVGEAK